MNLRKMKRLTRHLENVPVHKDLPSVTVPKGYCSNEGLVSSTAYSNTLWTRVGCVGGDLFQKCHVPVEHFGAGRAIR